MNKTLRLFAFLLFSVATLSVCAEKPVISILGDSYSTYEGAVWPKKNRVWYKIEKTEKTDVNAVGQTWWSLLTAEDTPYKLGVNNSYSGATISFSGYNSNDYSDRSFINRMYGLGNPDIILIFGGTNDAWAGAPMGEYQDCNYTRADLFNFRPALAYLVQNLRRLYPNASIYFMLNDCLKEEVNISAKEICAQYGIGFIALSGIDKQERHPTIAGMETIARQMRAVLDPIHAPRRK